MSSGFDSCTPCHALVYMDYFNKRKYKRYDVNVPITISDGRKVHESVVKNISQKGIMVSDIPKKFDYTNNEWSGVFRMNDINLKMKFQPMWVSDSSEPSLTAGFKISKFPLDWITIVDSFDDDKCVWGNC